MSPRCGGSRQGWRPTGSAWRVEGLEGRQLLAAGFSMSLYSVVPRSGPALVELYRLSDASGGLGAEAVEIGLSGGTAARGVDYPESKVTVRFEAGEFIKTFQVPVLAADPTLGTRTVILSTPPNPDFPSTSSATLTIVHGQDATPPRVVSARAIVKKGNVTALVLTYSEDMQRGAVEDVNSYTVTDPRSPRRANKSQGMVAKGSVPISSAVYDPATRSVTLTVAGRLRKGPVLFVQNREYVDAMNRDASPIPPTADRIRPESRMADLAGNPLGGSGYGIPDGTLFVPVPTGRRL